MLLVLPLLKLTFHALDEDPANGGHGFWVRLLCVAAGATSRWEPVG